MLLPQAATGLRQTHRQYHFPVHVDRGVVLQVLYDEVWYARQPRRLGLLSHKLGRRPGRDRRVVDYVQRVVLPSDRRLRLQRQRRLRHQDLHGRSGALASAHRASGGRYHR